MTCEVSLNLVLSFADIARTSVLPKGIADATWRVAASPSVVQSHGNPALGQVTASCPVILLASFCDVDGLFFGLDLPLWCGRLSNDHWSDTSTQHEQCENHCD
jgi:hypothetical protein